MTINEIKQSKKTFLSINKNVFNITQNFPNIKEKYNREEGTFKRLLSKRLSFVFLAPRVRMTASYLSSEVTFSRILKIKHDLSTKCDRL